MAEAEPDQITFVMAVGDQRFCRTVPEGTLAVKAMRDMIREDSRWIEVDDLQWIMRDHVLYAYLSRSDSGPLVGFGS